MSHRSSWDLKEVCGQSIPQLEQGSKRACGGKVGSPVVLSVSGLTFLDSPPGGAGGADAPLPHSGGFGKGKREEGKGLIVPGKTKSVEVEAGARTLEGVDTVCTANSSTTIIYSHQLLPSNWKSSYSFTCCRKNGIRDCRKSRSQSSICTGGFEFTINNGYVYFGSVL